MKTKKSKKQAQLKVNSEIRAGFSLNALIDNMQSFATEVGDAAQGAYAGAQSALSESA